MNQNRTKMSNRTLPAALAVIGGALASPLAGAAVIFSDDFNSQTVGNKPGSPWTACADNGTTVKVRTALDTGDLFGAGTSNKIMDVLDSAATGGYIHKYAIASATTVETLSFDFYEPTRSGTGTKLYIQVGAGGISTLTNTVVFQAAMSNGFIGTPGLPAQANYTVGAVHHIDMVMNNSEATVNYAGGTQSVASRKIDVFIDGLLIVDEGGVMTSPWSIPPSVNTALSEFNFQSFSSDANQEVFIDNVKLTDSAVVVPEPAGGAVLLLGAGGMLHGRRLRHRAAR